MLKTPIFIVLVLLSAFVSSQDMYITEVRKWQEDLNTEFRNPEETPLSPKDLKKFKGLDFFAIDPKYKVEAVFVRTPNEPPFNMPTTTERLAVYQKYGELRFTLDGKELALPVYQSHSLKLKPGFENYLFLPFTDPSNGVESYGGGRYIDLRIPEGDSLTIDFNKAYNPSCAYSGSYSCPIPPKENDLPVPILAGVKAWKGH